jgi:hypothetical protein
LEKVHKKLQKDAVGFWFELKDQALVDRCPARFCGSTTISPQRYYLKFKKTENYIQCIVHFITMTTNILVKRFVPRVIDYSHHDNPKNLEKIVPSKICILIFHVVIDTNITFA